MGDEVSGNNAKQIGAEWLHGALGLADDETPFPWQFELFHRFLRGDSIQALDIPTGLGKTATMAVWLVARALGAPLPRRLVYVVDRRAVVDQATNVAVGLRDWVAKETLVAKNLGIPDRPLPISTLRGQFIDNREWLEDPSAPAILVGTVDMVGSRLLFSGYGVSTKMRPYHAGLLGADTLVVLDEAHLVPAFEDLLRQVEAGADAFGPNDPALRALIPRFTLLSLSATGRETGSTSLTLTDADHRDPVVSKRLNAKKSLTSVDLATDSPLASELAKQAWMLTNQGSDPVRCLIFCSARKDATNVASELRSLAQSASAPKPTVELFVGARRVRERIHARDALARLGFLAGTSANRERAVFLVATSAGEVGVDLDADHMVCDLVAWERMVQRLGRVNRRGDGDARVVVVIDGEPVASDKVRALQDKRDKATGTRDEISSRERTHEPQLRELQSAVGEARRTIEQLERALADHKGQKPAGRKSPEQKETQRVWTERQQELQRDLKTTKQVHKQKDQKRESLEKSLAPSAQEKKVIKAFKDADAKVVARHEAEVAKHRALRALLAAVGEGGNLSPESLVQLRERPDLAEALRDATTVEPLRPELTRALVDAWSMTSLDEHPGRPEIDPWLRGFHPNDPPQTTLVWRRHLPARNDCLFDAKAAKRFFEAAPPHTSEQLEAETHLVLDWLITRAQAVGKAEKDTAPLCPVATVAIALGRRGQVKDSLTLEQLGAAKGQEGKKERERLQRLLAGATLIVDARLGGLTDGLLDTKGSGMADAADEPSTTWLLRPDAPDVPVTGFRVRHLQRGEQDDTTPTWRTAPGNGWVRRHLFVTEEVDGEPSAALAIDGWVGDAATEDERGEANRPQQLEEHQIWAEACARDIGRRLGLDEDYENLLALAARLHDEGKRAVLWQRAFKAPCDGLVYAKATGPIDFAILDGYRHELGSLPYAENHGALAKLSNDAKDLVLHLIAAHHGYARPVIGTSGCDDAPPSVVDERAREVALRFARLSRRWGPWGLAWWEASLRSADQTASRRHQRAGSPAAHKEQI